MNVREMIELLSAFDPTVEVVVEYDGQYQKVKAVQAQVMLTDGASWGDYQGAEALKVNPLYPASEEEQELNVASPREVVVAIWGSLPPSGLGVDPKRKG
ncbi:hypothetical protein DT385_01470 [Pseudomonas syringae]|nr:hypothetical protein DT385_01470 [Pseudomonas syringae]